MQGGELGGVCSGPGERRWCVDGGGVPPGFADVSSASTRAKGARGIPDDAALHLGGEHSREADLRL